MQHPLGPCPDLAVASDVDAPEIMRRTMSAAKHLDGLVRPGTAADGVPGGDETLDHGMAEAAADARQYDSLGSLGVHLALSRV